MLGMGVVVYRWGGGRSGRVSRDRVKRGGGSGGGVYRGMGGVEVVVDRGMRLG